MNKDFIIGKDGHVGLTRQKAAELLRVGHSTISGIVRAGMFTPQEINAIDFQGIRSYELTKLCTYYSVASRVSPEVRQHCAELLEDADNFQASIDEMASRVERPQKPKPIAVKVSYQYNEPIDFIRGDDGHAGLSQRKVAELLKVSQQSISRSLKNDNLFDRKEAESIATQGVRGDHLVKLAGHFSQSPQVSAEAKRHCVELLEKAAIIGVQTFIDRMAGIAEAAQYPKPALLPEPTPAERLYIVKESIAILSELGGLDDRTKLALSDQVRNIVLGDELTQTPSAGTEQIREWTISDRVVVLGYKAQQNSVLSGIGMIAANLYRKKYNGQNPPTRNQYVDGACRAVNAYTTVDLDIIDQAICKKLGEPPSNIRRLPPAK